MKINNYLELKSEIQRLEAKSKRQEIILHDKFRAVREGLKPHNLIMNSIASVTGIPFNKSDIVKKGALIALTYLVQRFMRNSEIRIETAISDFILKLKNKFKDFFGGKEEENNVKNYPDNTEDL
jgi:hypothetical protein